MNYEPIKYETESIGEREYWFANEKYAGLYVVIKVDVLNTSSNDSLDDEAYEDLQMFVPNDWQSWRLEETKEAL